MANYLQVGAPVSVINQEEEDPLPPPLPPDMDPRLLAQLRQPYTLSQVAPGPAMGPDDPGSEYLDEIPPDAGGPDAPPAPADVANSGPVPQSPEDQDVMSHLPEEDRQQTERAAREAGLPIPGDIAPAQPGRNTQHTDEYKRLLGERPVPGKPKWYQTLAAGALGGAVGWTNAAGRIRHPLDATDAINGIKYPGYGTKLDDWRNRVITEGKLAEIEGKQNATARQDRQDLSADELRKAQANAATEHAAYWRKRAQTEANRYHVNAKGQVVDLLTGEIKNKPPTLQERYDEYKRLPGISDEDARIAAINGKLPDRTDKSKTQWESFLELTHGDVAKARELWNSDEIAKATALAKIRQRPKSAVESEAEDRRQETFDNAISKDKDKTENDLQQQRIADLRAIAAATVAPETKAQQISDINRKTVAGLQANQNRYEERVKRRYGVAPEHFIVSMGPDGGPVWTKAGAKPNLDPFNGNHPPPKKIDLKAFDQRRKQ